MGTREKPIEFNGTIYNSIKEFCVYAGITGKDEHRFRTYLGKYNGDVDKALKPLFCPGVVDFNIDFGVSAKRFEEICRRYKVRNRAELYWRLLIYDNEKAAIDSYINEFGVIDGCLELIDTILTSGDVERPREHKAKVKNNISPEDEIDIEKQEVVCLDESIIDKYTELRNAESQLNKDKKALEIELKKQRALLEAVYVEDEELLKIRKKIEEAIKRLKENEDKIKNNAEKSAEYSENIAEITQKIDSINNEISVNKEKQQELRDEASKGSENPVKLYKRVGRPPKYGRSVEYTDNARGVYKKRGRPKKNSANEIKPENETENEENMHFSINMDNLESTAFIINMLNTTYSSGIMTQNVYEILREKSAHTQYYLFNGKVTISKLLKTYLGMDKYNLVFDKLVKNNNRLKHRFMEELGKVLRDIDNDVVALLEQGERLRNEEISVYVLAMACKKLYYEPV